MRRILLVDDEAIIATQLEERLVRMGYEVAGIASSGREAVDMAGRLLPDLILMDIVMPGEMDGIAAARLIRSEHRIPFIFLTAHTDEGLITRAKEVEPLGYILKPFQDAQITASIEIALHNDDMARNLRQSEKRFRDLVEIIPLPIMEIDRQLKIVFANPACHGMLNYPQGGLSGRAITDTLCPGPETAKALRYIRSALENQPAPSPAVLRGLTAAGRAIDVEISWDYQRDGRNRVTGLIAVLADITKRLDFEASMRRSHEEMEKRVNIRTKELVYANKKLKKEIKNRKIAEKELETKTNNLEEINTALKILLSKRNESQLELEEKILLNVKELILPYFDKLSSTQLDSTQTAYLEILESNFMDIISPFSKRLSSRFWNFTPAEVKIANLIKLGKTTKEIAIILRLSTRTIDTHRKNIRKKLSIDGQKINMRSQLISIQ
jgi:PAS domain S-box-containing protein